MKKLLRSKKALAVYAIITGLIIFMLYRGNITVGITEISLQDENIPDGFDDFKIIQISDLHNAEFGENQKIITEMINEQEPDMVVITGDFVDSRNTDTDTAMELIDGLDKDIDVYYVPGNHESRINEYEELENRLKESGVTVLRNEKCTLERKGDTITLAGIDDPSFGLSEKELLETMENLKDENFTILLSHRPELFDLYCEAGIDLVFCGHAHGGQVRIPFVGGLAAPGQGLFPEYTEGMYGDGETKMVVSRGLGNSIIPLRINNPPEIVCLTLVAE